MWGSFNENEYLSVLSDALNMMHVFWYMYVLLCIICYDDCRLGGQKWWMMLTEHKLWNKLIPAMNPELQFYHLIANLSTN